MKRGGTDTAAAWSACHTAAQFVRAGSALHTVEITKEEGRRASSSYQTTFSDGTAQRSRLHPRRSEGGIYRRKPEPRGDRSTSTPPPQNLDRHDLSGRHVDLHVHAAGKRIRLDWAEQKVTQGVT